VTEEQPDAPLENDGRDDEAACRPYGGDRCVRASRPSVSSVCLDRNGPAAWAANTARHLLVNGDIQDGFRHLIAAGRADLTVEWPALHPRWHRTFQAPHREAARWRLRQAGVDNFPDE
jgi:hypothetical protein